MSFRKLVAFLFLVVISVTPLTASAAKYDEAALKPVAYTMCYADEKEKAEGIDLNYFLVKDTVSVPVRHAINREIINAVADLCLEYKDAIEAKNCTIKITPEIRFNEAGILSATFTSEGMLKGAAHGFKAMKAVNFNYITGEEITVESLNDLYKAAKLAPAYTKENINKLLKAKAKAGKLELLQGFKGIDELPDFYLTGKAMDIYAFFEPYEIAPYSSGIVELLVD